MKWIPIIFLPIALNTIFGVISFGLKHGEQAIYLGSGLRALFFIVGIFISIMLYKKNKISISLSKIIFAASLFTSVWGIIFGLTVKVIIASVLASTYLAIFIGCLYILEKSEYFKMVQNQNA